MIVGIPTDDGVTVSEHFGRSKKFMLIRIENGRVAERKLVDNPHSENSDDQAGHGRLLKMFTDNKVERVICSNLNPRMERNLNSLKISVERVDMNTGIEEALKAEVHRNM